MVNNRKRHLASAASIGLTAALVVLTLVGCANAPVTVTPNAGQAETQGEVAAASVPTSAPVPAPITGGTAGATKVQVKFLDLDSFDKALEQALASGASEVEIVLVTPMSPNAIAPRLGRWINTVQENGGEVKVDSDVRTRSASILISLMDAALGAWRDLRAKMLVKNVDAEMVLRANQIESVRLTRRTAS